MRILVCGGRYYRDYKTLEKVLDVLRNGAPAVIIHGGATGADALADAYARDSSKLCDVKVYPADWARYDRAAGPLRNHWMLTDAKPDVVIAFPGGRGTANMLRIAQCANVPTVVIAPAPNSTINLEAE